MNTNLIVVTSYFPWLVLLVAFKQIIVSRHCLIIKHEAFSSLERLEVESDECTEKSIYLT
jgi:hypothetical protein